MSKIAKCKMDAKFIKKRYNNEHHQDIVKTL
jgi:hypothetical protein